MNFIVESFLDGDDGYCLDPNHVILPSFDEARHSTKNNGMIQAYAANTNQGVFRNYNEDRVSIILNITMPAFKELDHWPTCSFFAVYDGHGGASCADFLRDNLHQFIIKQDSFPSDPHTAIREGFQDAEDFFLEIVENAADEAMREAGATDHEGFVDNSGSCAIVILIVDQKVYVANVGDSRALMSADGGRRVLELSKDHKPNEERETVRIIKNGGKIYQTQTVVPKMDGNGNEWILGPHRVYPGRLSVSRSFGDIEAKLPKYGGNMKGIIATPEIRVFDVDDSMDYIILACDGIFDKLTNKEVIQSVWEGVMESNIKDPHKQCGIGVDRILRTSVAKKTMDNITVVFVAFNNFERWILDGPKQFQHNIQKVNLSPHGYVVDEEAMDEQDYPPYCISDFWYVKGRCETPPFLRLGGPKGIKDTFDAPTIITANPEELWNEPPQVIPGYEDYIFDMKNNIIETEAFLESDKELKTEEIDEGEIQHPYDNLNSQDKDESHRQIDPTRKEPKHINPSHQMQIDKSQSHDHSKNHFDSFEPGQKVQKASKIEPKKNFKTSVTQKIPEHISGIPYKTRPESQEGKKPRAAKSAKRGSSESTKKASNKIVANSGIAKNQKRASSNKDRKQKSSPIRTTKVTGKNEMGMTHYFPGKPKNTSSKGKFISKATNSGRTGKGNPGYKEPIHQHAGLIKANNLNLSLGNYKTEMQLPHPTKYMAEPKFAKSPFLSKTLQGMMQPKPASKKRVKEYGRMGYPFQAKSGRKKREGSAHSNKSKRDASNSHKKGGKNKQLFNTKKLSFNYHTGKQMQNLSDILSKNALNTSKIYSRNDKTMGFSTAGHFLTTGDGMVERKYSNRARQPKQTYYINKKRMNKTMVGGMSKSGHQDYSFSHSQSKRSGSGKVKKRSSYAKDNLVRERSTKDSGDRDLKYSLKSKSQKPKSGRGISRNNKNTAIYNMAPVMNMTYKNKY